MHSFVITHMQERKTKKYLKILKKGVDKRVRFCYNIGRDWCWCGSMAEQLICNQQVDGSTPFTSSIFYGGIPERPKGADCKSVVTDFGGPNPPAPTRKKHTFVYQDNVCFFQRNSPSASEIAPLWNICFANVKRRISFIYGVSFNYWLMNHWLSFIIVL